MSHDNIYRIVVLKAQPWTFMPEHESHNFKYVTSATDTAALTEDTPMTEKL